MASLTVKDQGDMWKEGNKCLSQYGLTALSLCRFGHGIFELEQNVFRYYGNHSVAIVSSSVAFPHEAVFRISTVVDIMHTFMHASKIHVLVLWRNT